MTKYFLSGIFSVLVIFLGCSEGKLSFQTRKKNAVDALEKYDLRKTNVFMSTTARLALSALKSSVLSPSKTPIIAYSVVIERDDRACTLYVSWIEDRPTVENIEFSNDGVTSAFFSTEAGSEHDREQASRTVLFYRAIKWEPHSTHAKKIQGLNDPGGLRVRLLRGGTAVTEWFPVDLFRGGKWISNKE